VLIRLKLPVSFTLYGNISHEEVKQNKAVLEVFEGKCSIFILLVISPDAKVQTVILSKSLLKFHRKQLCLR
jgi:hypothetical protein